MKYIYNGTEYHSFRECCKKLNIRYNYIYELMKAGTVKTKEEALKYALDEKNKRYKYTYNGVEYYSFKKCCDALGVSYDAVYSLITKRNYTREEALGYVLNKRKYIYNGIEYSSFRKCCITLGVCYNSVMARSYIRNCSKEESLEYYLSKKAD